MDKRISLIFYRPKYHVLFFPANLFIAKICISCYEISATFGESRGRGEGEQVLADLAFKASETLLHG